MQEILNKIINEKLNTEEVENKIATIVEKGICRTIEELFSWGGTWKKELEKRLNEKMNEILDNDLIENTASKMNFLINQAVKNSETENFDSVLKKIQDILGVEDLPKKRSEINLNYLYNKYKDFAEREIKKIDPDDALDYEDPIDYLDGGDLNLHFNIKLTSELIYEKESYLYKNEIHKMYVLKFETRCNESDKIIDDLCFEIFVTNNNSKYSFTSDNFYQFYLLNSFELFLMKLKNNGIYMKEESLDYEKEEEIYQTFEYGDY